MNVWILAALLTAGAAEQARPSTPEHEGQSKPPAQSGPAAPRTSLEISGQVVMSSDVLPRRDAFELRPRAVIDADGRVGSAIRYRVNARFEALVADRGATVTDAVARVRDAWLSVGGDRATLRVGLGRVVWGRLDEVQPSDVINPLDVSRFLLDGRSEARLPVALVHARFDPSDTLRLEAVLAPIFARGRFDELDEPTSPFNLVNDAVLPVAPFGAVSLVYEEPATTWANMSGGGRVSATVGRVDIAAAVYRGWEGFGLITAEQVVPVPGQPAPPVVARLVERYPRFTMVAGDVETVAGEWALRGEIAAFVDKRFLSVTRPGVVVRGRALDAGAGFDRATGEFRVFGSVLLRREWSEEDAAIARSNVSLIGSIERRFARDRYLARAFGAVNPADASAFLRALVVYSVRDNVSLEGSAAAFLGTGDDALARFTGRDFVFLRVGYHF